MLMTPYSEGKTLLRSVAARLNERLELLEPKEAVRFHGPKSTFGTSFLSEDYQLVGDAVLAFDGGSAGGECGPNKGLSLSGSRANLVRFGAMD